MWVPVVFNFKFNVTLALLLVEESRAGAGPYSCHDTRSSTIADHVTSDDGRFREARAVQCNVHAVITEEGEHQALSLISNPMGQRT